MRDGWLDLLALGALMLFIIWCARPPTSQRVPEVVTPKAPRVLKPRTPEDCPFCRRPHPTLLLGKVRQLGVKPWRARNSRRGPAKRICTPGHPVLIQPVLTTGIRSRPLTPWWAMAFAMAFNN